MPRYFFDINDGGARGSQGRPPRPQAEHLKILLFRNLGSPIASHINNIPTIPKNILDLLKAEIAPMLSCNEAQAIDANLY